MTKEKFKEFMKELSENDVVSMNVAIFGEDVSVGMCGGKDDASPEEVLFGLLGCYAAITTSITENFGIPTHMLYAMTEEMMRTKDIIKPVEPEMTYAENVRPFIPSHA